MTNPMPAGNPCTLHLHAALPSIAAASCLHLLLPADGLHLVNLAVALKECHRLLKPQGYLCAAWNDRYAPPPQALVNVFFILARFQWQSMP